MSAPRSKLQQEAVALFETLKKDFGNGKKADLAKCGTLLSQLKVKLTELSFLTAGTSSEDAESVKEALLAREVLELGAQWSILARDIPSFERYVAQLQTYYFDYGKILPTSQRMYAVLGLNLLRLLAQNRIAEFHAQLELIDAEQIHSNVFIKHPVQLEQCLMEGSYNKVWHARSDVPGEEYLFFMDILMGTIRKEIANSCEKAYASLPLSDATSLFYLKDANELNAFVQSNGWTVNASEKKIVFDNHATAQVAIPSKELIQNFLGYARELERIV